MKKILYLVMAFMLIWSCTRDPQVNDTSPKACDALTVGEAKAFFEQYYATGKSTRTNSGNEKPAPLYPGEFTPRWDKARTSQTKLVASVDIPIIPQYRFRAIRTQHSNGIVSAYEVEITQKVVVVKSMKSDKMSQYILTLIPDKGYYAKNKGDISDKFLNSGDKGGFSGLAIYYSVNKRFAIRVDKYHNGSRSGGYNLLGDGKEKSGEILVKAGELIGEIYIKGYSNATIATRSLGEDLWPELPCWECGSTSCSGCGGDVIITPDYCPGCGNYVYACTCSQVCIYCGNYPCTCGDFWICPICGGYPCVCNICPTCGNDPCTCAPPDVEEEKEEENKKLQLDCDKVDPSAAENGKKATDLNKKISNALGFSNFTDAVADAPGQEFGITAYQKTGPVIGNNIYLTQPYTDGASTHVHPRIIMGDNIINFGMTHNHPSETSCSTGDVLALIQLNIDNPSFESIMVYTLGGEYFMITIYDTTMLGEFVSGPNFGGAQNPAASLQGCFQEAYLYITQIMHLSAKEAQLYALAYALNTLKIGIALLSKDKDSNLFKQHNSFGIYGSYGQLIDLYLVDCK